MDRKHYTVLSKQDVCDGYLEPGDVFTRSCSSDTYRDSSNMETKDDPEGTSSKEERPWWQANFTISSPVLFGTWDGVFASCMVNIFGVVIFLRSGWIVGNAGLDSSFVIIILTESVSVVTVMSAIGICHTSNLNCAGGVYTVISHVLGSRIATPVALLYCLGQAISCSLCVLAFGESITDLLYWKNIWLERLIACAALLFILGVLALGVTWLIGLQILLILLLFVAITDFVLGSFIVKDLRVGVVGYNKKTLLSNTGPGYIPGENFFTVLGVYFPMSGGVLAGFNMTGDVKDPPSNVPKGTMAAIFISSAIYLLFSFILSATCTRDALRTDYMIAEKLSATHILWLIGLYQLSLSSAVGNLCGCPQALMGVAADKVFTLLNPLAKGSGPNQVPVLATSALALVSAVFLMFGQLNSLSVISTVLYLITYSFVNYAYFILCMSIRQNEKFDHPPDRRESGSTIITVAHNDRRKSRCSMEKIPEGDQVGRKDSESESPLTRQDVAGHTRRMSSVNLKRASVTKEEIEEPEQNILFIFEQPANWTFAALCHPMVSIIGALFCLTSSFLIHWIFTLITLLSVSVVWFVIGIVNPGVPPGVGRFSYAKWLKQHFGKLCRSQPVQERQIVFTYPFPKMKVKVTKQPSIDEDCPDVGGEEANKVELVKAHWLPLVQLIDRREIR